MTKYLLISLLAFWLAGCAASEPTPEYLVRVGGRYDWRCGGYAVDPWHVVTADHCTRYALSRVQAEGKEPVAAIIVARWPELDAAMYETAEPLGLDSYAVLRAFVPGEPAFAFGYCPLWNSTAARFAQYTATETKPLSCHEFHLDGAYICSGDSGGVIAQDGSVAGMIAQFRGKSFALEDGPTVAYSTCAVPGETIARRVEEWRGER